MVIGVVSVVVSVAIHIAIVAAHAADEHRRIQRIVHDIRSRGPVLEVSVATVDGSLVMSLVRIVDGVKVRTVTSLEIQGMSEDDS